MAGKEFDRVRVQSALEVVKQHPAMVLFVASPAIIALGVIWWFVGAGWAALLLIAMVVAGGAAIVLKRK
jgi:hypothetical protein